MKGPVFTLICLVLLARLTLTIASQRTASKERSLRKVAGYYQNISHTQDRTHDIGKKLHHKWPGAAKHGDSDTLYEVINRNACSLCEPLVGQRVCGIDGRTYVTLCHAINCAGLTEEQIVMGTCTETSICQQANCKKGATCIPKLSQCVPWLINRKPIPCKPHQCTAKCKEAEQVCGMDQRTYSSLCSLYKARTSLAYRGMCKSSKCQSAVCGTDGETYRSSCHAKAQGVQVHYMGDCFSDQQLDYEYKRGSVCGLIATRCKNVTCIEPFVPLDSCCKTCGGGLLLQQKTVTKASRRIIKKFDYNTVPTVRNAIVDLLPSETEISCDLSVTLTNNGYIAVLLESIVHQRSLFCKAVARELAGRISNPSSRLEPPTSLLTELYEVHIPDLTTHHLPTPAMFIGFDPLGDLQDATYDLKNQAENEASNTYGGGVEKVDDHLGDAEDKAYDDAVISATFSYATIIFNVILILVTII